MAKVEKGSCPSCLNECDLVFFKYGVITTTMCPYCMVRYLKTSVIPKLANKSDSDSSEVFSNDKS